VLLRVEVAEDLEQLLLGHRIASFVGGDGGVDSLDHGAEAFALLREQLALFAERSAAIEVRRAHERTDVLQREPQFAVEQACCRRSRSPSSYRRYPDSLRPLGLTSPIS